MEAFVLLLARDRSAIDQLSKELPRAFQSFAWVEGSHIVRGEAGEGELIHLRLRAKEANSLISSLRQRITSAHPGVGDFEIFYIR